MKDQIRSLTSLPCAPDGKSDPTVLVKNLHETKFSSKSRQGIYLRHFPTKRKVKGISLHISVAQKESREATRRDQDSKRQNENRVQDLDCTKWQTSESLIANKTGLMAKWHY